MKRSYLPTLSAFASIALLFGCASSDSTMQSDATDGAALPTVGHIERLDPRLDALIPPGAEMQVIADGHDWTEGPVWVEAIESLIWSDIPPNALYSWNEDRGAGLYLQPSGYTGTEPRGGEKGSNGLTLDPQGRLVLAQHGDRRIARMDAPFASPQPKFVTLVDNWRGNRFNSPNDLVFAPDGTLYFTDPPYGLEGYVDDPEKDLPFQGVYRLGTDGSLSLLTQQLSRPNGIGLSPDGRKLYVANSDPDRAIWMVYHLNLDGTLGAGRQLHDATAQVGQAHGLPDGLVVDSDGNVYASGPGGVFVFHADGTHLGTLHTTQATSNCTLGGRTGTTLFITADRYVLKVETRSMAIGR